MSPHLAGSFPRLGTWSQTPMLSTSRRLGPNSQAQPGLGLGVQRGGPGASGCLLSPGFGCHEGRLRLGAQNAETGSRGSGGSSRPRRLGRGSRPAQPLGSRAREGKGPARVSGPRGRWGRVPTSPRCAPTCPPRPARLGLSTEHPGWSLSRLPDVATRAERCPRSLTLLSRPGAGNAEGLLRPLGGQPGTDGN